MIQKKDKKYLKKDKEFNLALEKYFESDYYNEPNKENNTIDKLYYSSNEVLDNEFENFGDISGKRVLTVGSSADQMMSAILYGASDVTLIDANIFSRYFAEYKIAMMKNFEWEEYYKNFMMGGYASGKIFEHKVFSRIFHDLSPEAQEFWGTIFIEDGMPKDIAKNLFHESSARRINYFAYKDSYNQCKKNLESAQVNFITADLSEFPKVIDGKYDLIMLSNIFDYMCGKENKKKYINVVNELYKKHLNPDGKIQAYYCFGGCGIGFEDIKKYLKTKHGTIEKQDFRLDVAKQFVIQKDDDGRNLD